MTPSTGLPPVFLTSDRTLSSPPLLVEIVSITEVGHSAFQLQNTRQMRIDRADLAGLNAERGENGEQEEEEEGPVPRYPRSMLKLELTDGTVTFRAIEYKRMPDLVLGETPLGYKVLCVLLYHSTFMDRVPQMLLKNVMFRQGIAFLEPANVVLKGHSTEDRQAQQDANFLRGLKRRMGYTSLLFFYQYTELVS
jgi:RecQ-mediated genome instability protein 1